MDSQTIAQKIKSIRKELGYTQAEFGRALGNVSYSTVSDWENAKNIPSDANLCKIAEISRGKLADLFEPANEEDQSSGDSQMIEQLEETNKELLLSNEELREQLEEEERKRKKLKKKKEKLKKKIKDLE